MRMLAQVLVLLAGLLPLQAKDAVAPLGSPEYRPSPEQPFGWRGDGSGRFPGAAPVLEWSATKNVRWSAVVGKSFASPILVGGLVVVLSEPNLLIALDAAGGGLKWKKEIAVAELADAEARTAAEEYKPRDTGLSAATPVSDGERIYAILANGIVQAVDLAGKAAWTSFVSAKQNTAYGRSASPVLSGGKLFVHMTNLYAFDPASGRQLWVNAEARCQYGTPAVLRANQESLVVTPAGDVLRAADGKALNDKIGNTSNVSPLVQDGLIYYAEKEIRAVRLGADFKDESVWDGEIPGEVFGSPIVHNGLLFTSTGKGELVVFDLQKKGSPPVFEPRQLFGEEAGGLPLAYSSFALAGNHLFIVSNGGEVAVLEATREAKRVALNRLTDGSGASPVFSGKQIFLRDGDKLYCIGAQP